MTEKDDGQRYEVRWWDERAQRWGTGLTLRQAQLQQGILRGLHKRVEIVPVDPAKRRR